MPNLSKFSSLFCHLVGNCHIKSSVPFYVRTFLEVLSPFANENLSILSSPVNKRLASSNLSTSHPKKLCSPLEFDSGERKKIFLSLCHAKHVKHAWIVCNPHVHVCIWLCVSQVTKGKICEEKWQCRRIWGDFWELASQKALSGDHPQRLLIQSACLNRLQQLRIRK